MSTWKSIPTKTYGLTRFKSTSGPGAKGYIQRFKDGTAHAQVRTGLFGLGASSTMDMAAPAPSDEVILQKFDDFRDPPRFDNWKETGRSTDSEARFKGSDPSGGTVNATIERRQTDKGETAEVEITTGWLGLGATTSATYFAPAPGNQDILTQLS